ncbi:helix-turn-helix domain-containing protein [Bradyrhizobium sp. 18]|jgi:predicted DNA-binding transcriptional regulator AlpA|nr:helix-turn-helix domain-containing protein [Bradyrhizobium sp. 18]
MKANIKTNVLGDLIDRETAAHLLGVAPRTLDRWHREHAGPPRVLIGRKVRYRRTSLDDWVRGLERGG